MTDKKKPTPPPIRLVKNAEDKKPKPSVEKSK